MQKSFEEKQIFRSSSTKPLFALLINRPFSLNKHMMVNCYTVLFELLYTQVQIYSIYLKYFL